MMNRGAEQDSKSLLECAGVKPLIILPFAGVISYKILYSYSTEKDNNKDALFPWCLKVYISARMKLLLKGKSEIMLSSKYFQCGVTGSNVVVLEISRHL